MDLWNWILQSLQVDSWGVTPISLVAPFGLLAMMVMVRRFAREKGPNMESRDIGGMALIVVIVGAAFLWVFAGVGLIERSFH